MTMQLSGYLPGEKATNLPDLAEDLVTAFDRHRAEHDESAILIPVVGMLRVESVRYLRDPDAEPVVGVRFAGIEAAAGLTGSRHETAVRDLWRRLRDDRVGDTPLDLDWTSEPPAEEEPAPGEGERYDHGSEDADGFHDPGAAPGVATTTPPPPASFSDAKTKRERGQK